LAAGRRSHQTLLPSRLHDEQEEEDSILVRRRQIHKDSSSLLTSRRTQHLAAMTKKNTATSPCTQLECRNGALQNTGIKPKRQEDT
jgi:hypothetical protein